MKERVWILAPLLARPDFGLQGIGPQWSHLRSREGHYKIADHTCQWIAAGAPGKCRGSEETNKGPANWVSALLPPLPNCTLLFSTLFFSLKIESSSFSWFWCSITHSHVTFLTMKSIQAWTPRDLSASHRSWISYWEIVRITWGNTLFKRLSHFLTQNIKDTQLL